MTNSVKILAVGLWAAASIVAFWYLPLFVSVIYLVACAVGWQLFKRVDRRRRAEALADADDIRRVGDEPQRSTGPASKGYGGFSWGRREPR